MIIRRFAGIAVAILALGAPFAARAATPVTLPVGTVVSLVTVDALSSKTSVKGDIVSLRTEGDVLIDGIIAIPKGVDATGQVIDAQAKGALGMSGRLVIRPLYVRIGSDIVRLTGAFTGKGSVTAGAIMGMVALTPGFTGRSAVIPVGTKVAAVVEKAVTLEREGPRP